MVKKIIVPLFFMMFLSLPQAECSPINRTLLTVQSDVYTTAQAELILSIWGKIQNNKLRPALVKENGVSLNVVGGQADILAAYKKWPIEAQDLFFLAVTWWEVKRLSLFTIPLSELEKRTTEIRSQFTSQGASAAVQPFLLPDSNDFFRKAVEQAIRAQNYLKVRGDLEKNTSLLNVSWYWHGVPSRPLK